MSKIVGVVYPVPLQLADRLFVAHRNVFVKYVARTTKLRIAPRQKVLFYASQGTKDVVGEGTIETIEFLTPKEVVEKYGKTVFLNEDELMEYTMRQPGRTPSKKMVVLNLSRLRRYPPEVKYERSITMAGEYLTQEKYSALLRKVSEYRS